MDSLDWMSLLNNPENWPILQNILLGIGLSAACGFRIFLPPLVVSTAALFFGLQLPPEISWMGSQTAFIICLTAGILEIAAYYIPWLDNALDNIASPTAVVAGTLSSVSFMGELPPEIKWPLAIIAGGGVAGTFQAVTHTSRLTSALTTFGLANPIIATIENVMALLVSILAIAFPIFGAIFLLVGLLMGVWLLRFIVKMRQSSTRDDRGTQGTG